MMSKSSAKSELPEVIALQALAFLAAEPARLQPFMSLSGIDPATLRKRASEPELLAAVMDHLLGDESLLFLFCETENLAPQVIAAARRGLPGGMLQD